MATSAEPVAGRTRIVTLTMNPALDITTSVGVVRPTERSVGNCGRCSNAEDARYGGLRARAC